MLKPEFKVLLKQELSKQKNWFQQVREFVGDKNLNVQDDFVSQDMLVNYRKQKKHLLKYKDTNLHVCFENRLNPVSLDRLD